MGTPMPLRKPTEPVYDKASPGVFLVEAAPALEDLLASGGDRRLGLSEHDQRNSYGCTPFPRPTLLDFGSSTASSISQRAYARVQAAQAQMWMAATLNGAEGPFDDHIEAQRNTLRTQLDVAGAEVVFSPSGTDAQLQVLFLVKALLGAALTTIIVGADQTGSGTAHTARGQHFSDCTSLGTQVEKGSPIAGLCEQVGTLGISFCDEAGKLRTDAEMDAAVTAAVAGAVGRGEKILLQIMDASKLGWRAPSAACMETIVAAWPDHVCVVVDACQMRVGRPQLKDYLARGYFVLVTGSKFFTGPAFSGALLVPGALAGAIDGIAAVPPGLGSYTTSHDWPRRWHRLRQALPVKPNYGQWLRWEATLVEMEAYFAVPREFRIGVLGALAARMPQMIAASPNLDLLAEQRGQSDPALSDEMRHPTIHAFVPQQAGQPLTPDRAASLYRAMGRDLSRQLPGGDPVRGIAARICQIGQPVALRHRPGAALRLSASARLVSGCWARTTSIEEALAPVLADIGAVIEKLDWLITRPDICESEAT
jgi:hypothetical protein